MDRPISVPPDWVHHDQVYAADTVPRIWSIPPEIFQPIWDAGITGKGVRIAIDDTGLWQHPNLPAPVAARSFVGGNDTVDRHGHGTHVSGTALGRGGVGAAPEADLIVCKVLGDNGSGSTSGINAARLWASAEGADIISESLGGSQGDRSDIDSILKAYENGTQLCVAAAGNSGYRGGNTIGYPGRYMETWCVGSYRQDGAISTFSSGGREIDCATPGEQIISCKVGGGWTSMSGTSMATPLMSGLMALIIHKRRRAGFNDLYGSDEWRKFFSEQGFFEDAGEPGVDVRFGLGKPLIVNILAWLKEPVWI